jgi:pimeloyl-ACP methyl ester carboxylesterase
MTRTPARRLSALAALTLALGLTLSAGAAEVQTTHGGLKLNGNLELADGRTVADGVVLITHGTLAHGRMEITQAFQEMLKDRGVSSLAITLAYGLDNRSGMYDCAAPHTHRHADAVAEIGAWVTWLKGQGARRVTVLGHSRGGNQTAWYAAEQRDPVVGKVVLVAPMVQDAAGIASGYQKSFKKDVAPVVDRARELAAKGSKDLMKPVDILYCADTSATPESFLSYHAYDPHFNTPELVSKIQVPVLIVVGSADDVLPGLDQAFAPVVSPGRVELVVIDGADHFFRDLYAEEVVDAVAKMVGKP